MTKSKAGGDQYRTRLPSLKRGEGIRAGKIFAISTGFRPRISNFCHIGNAIHVERTSFLHLRAPQKNRSPEGISVKARPPAPQNFEMRKTWEPLKTQCIYARPMLPFFFPIQVTH